MDSGDIQKSHKEYQGEYGATTSQEWVEIANRHYCRDTVFLESLSVFFKPGKMLELGAGTGNFSEILLKMGFDIIPSDYSPWFVDVMREKGMDAQVVDALDIGSAIDEKFDTMITCGLSPLIRNSPNSEAIRQTYQSAHSSLNTGGRLIYIFPRYSVLRSLISNHISARGAYKAENRFHEKKKYATARTHVQVIREMGIFRIAKKFKHQVLPTSMYTEKNKKVLNRIDFAVGRAIGHRAIFVLDKVG